jgi:branched-chain amino acid transport system ATP-binding protein
MPDAGTPLLELRGADVRIGQLQVLWSVDVAIPRGSVTAILGSNGSGKSTCLGAMSGIRRCRGGSVLFDGESITSLNPRERVKLGLAHVLERQHVFADMTTKENLEVGGYTIADGHERAARLEHVLTIFPRLAPLLKSRAMNLSGGEQAMLVIGRALMHKPKLILLDEPFLGIAPSVVRDLESHIGALRDSGTTLVVVDQNVNRAVALAQHCVVLRGGRVVLQSPTSEPGLVETITELYMQHGPESGLEERMQVGS